MQSTATDQSSPHEQSLWGLDGWSSVLFGFSSWLSINCKWESAGAPRSRERPPWDGKDGPGRETPAAITTLRLQIIPSRVSCDCTRWPGLRACLSLVLLGPVAQGGAFSPRKIVQAQRSLRRPAVSRGPQNGPVAPGVPEPSARAHRWPVLSP